MKPLAKNLMLIAAACIAAGIMLVVFAFAMCGFNVQALSTDLPYEEKSYTYDGTKVKSLNIKGLEYDVELITSNDNQFKITTFENEKEQYEIKLSPSGELSIRYETTKRWYDYIRLNIDLDDRAITVAVPEGYLGPMDLSSNAGDVRMSGLNLKDTLEAETALGSIELNDLTSLKQMSFSSGSGTIQLKKVSAGGDIALETNLGDVKAESVQAAGKLSMKSGSGRIKLDESSVNNDLSINTNLGDVDIIATQIAGNMTVTTGSGALHLTQTAAKGDVTLETSLGDIIFRQLSGNNLYITSSSGEVQGNILGKADDYTIDARTSSGSLNVPHSANGPKLLQVSTGLGDIDIDFK